MKPKAILIDLDGTLVGNSQRALDFIAKYPDDYRDRWTEFFKDTVALDKPNEWCLDIVHTTKHKVVFLTGRTATLRTYEETREWLNLYVTGDYFLYMREVGDKSPHHEFKEKMLLNVIMPVFDVVLSIDDMGKNVAMTRSLGIPSLHCADFEG
jgi:FMN phosphatase YigB (HAD superfamily)